MSFDRKMVALAAAVAELESSAELLAAVELLTAHAGRVGDAGGTGIPGVIASKLGSSLAEFRTAFWEVERLSVPDMSSVEGGAGGPSPSDQLTALLPLVQGISSPEVAMRIVEEIGALAVHRMRGQWSSLWFDVRSRVAVALKDPVITERTLPTVSTVAGKNPEETHFREAPVVAILDYGPRTEAIQDPLGCGVLVYSEGKVWRLVAQGNTIMGCVPGPEEFCTDLLTGSVMPWWVASFDCRKSEGWLTYLAWFEKHWPGVYKGPRSEDRVRNGE